MKPAVTVRKEIGSGKIGGKVGDWLPPVGRRCGRCEGNRTFALRHAHDPARHAAHPNRLYWRRYSDDGAAGIPGPARARHARRCVGKARQRRPAGRSPTRAQRVDLGQKTPQIRGPVGLAAPDSGRAIRPGRDLAALCQHGLSHRVFESAGAGGLRQKPIKPVFHAPRAARHW